MTPKTFAIALLAIALLAIALLGGGIPHKSNFTPRFQYAPFEYDPIEYKLSVNECEQFYGEPSWRTVYGQDELELPDIHIAK